METFVKNDIVNIYIYAWERDDGNVTVDASSTFEVFDTSDSSVQTADTVTIADDGTATPDIFGLVDTSHANFSAGNTYYVLFTVVIGSETIQRRKTFYLE